MEISDLARKLAAAFSDRQLFLVGGSVRDQLLGRRGGDLDLATDARPEEIRRRVESWADSLWLVGEKFGTVGLEREGLKAEITTFRSDTYDGVSRKPEVTFGDDLRGDLARRDFTINAIAFDLHREELIDHFAGRGDLEARIVRFVGEAVERIAEDPLRMLRAVRFCAQLDFELDPAAEVAVAGSADALRRVSWERIRDELDGILLSDHPREGLRLLLDLGLAPHTLPELLRLQLPAPERHQMKDLLAHTLDAVAFTPPDKALRYAALLHDIAKPETISSDESGVHFYRHDVLGEEAARSTLARLRQPAALVKQVAVLIRHHLRIPYYRSQWTASAVRRLMFDLGEQLEAAFDLADADVRASDPSDYPEFQALLRELRARVHEVGEASELARMKPLLSGDDVMSLLSLPPGPKVGEVLHFLLDQQVEGAVGTREEAVEAVRNRFGRPDP